MKGWLNRRNLVWLSAVSVFFGLCNTSGNWMYHTDRLPASAEDALSFALQCLGGAVLFFCAASALLWLLPRIRKPGEPGPRKGKSVFWPAFGVILLGWLPWIVSYYPCSADYDVYVPIQMYLNLRPRSGSFPWFYSTLVGSLYSFGVSLGDRNIGLFLHILLRAPAMAAIYARLAEKLRKQNVRGGVVWAVILFYAFVPVWGAYAKHGFKDTVSAALFCWYVTETVELVRCIREGRYAFKPFVLYAVSLLLVGLFRGNGIYIAAPVTLFVVIAVLRQKKYREKLRWLRLTALCLSAFMVYGAYGLYARYVDQVAPGSMASALTIPLQQTARTVRDESETITQKEQKAIARALDYDRLGELYNPILSDPVKDTLVGWRAGKYLGTWLSMYPKHLRAYTEAAIAQSYGYYAFTPDQPEHAGNWNCGMTIFDWVVDPRYDPEFTGYYMEATEPVRVFLDNWAKTWHSLPVIGVLDDLPLYTWFIVLVGLHLILRKRPKSALIPVLACLLTVLFCCASPVNDCFRYFCPVAAAAPACLLLCAEPDEEKEDKTATPEAPAEEPS